MSVDYHHARDIPDETFIAAVEEAARARGFASATRWDVARILGGLDVSKDWIVDDVPGVPHKVVLAKARRLIGRGVLDGCDCGCRGDWMLR